MKFFMSTLAEVLARETREGELYETLSDGRLRCYACGHCCPLPEGAVGVCKVRFNESGRLLVPLPAPPLDGERRGDRAGARRGARA